MNAHPPPQPQYAPAPVRGPSPAPGIVCIVLGALGLILAALAGLIPGFLFLLGGGGNVDAFGDFASGFFTTAVVLLILGLAVLALGIVLTVRAVRRRRALRAGAQPIAAPMGYGRPIR